MPVIDVATSVAAIKQLREVHAKALGGGYSTRLQPSFTAKNEVLARFQPLFAPASIPNLTAEEFKSFPPFKSNHHWSDLPRRQALMCSDMNALKAGLMLLADEGQPIASRFDEALGSVHGLGKGTATAILLIMFPDKYGVWNGTSQAGLAKLDLLPLREGHTDGEYYVEINDVFGQLSRRMGVDLWTLDILWYYLLKG